MIRQLVESTDTDKQIQRLKNLVELLEKETNRLLSVGLSLLLREWKACVIVFGFLYYYYLCYQDKFKGLHIDGDKKKRELEIKEIQQIMFRCSEKFMYMMHSDCEISMNIIKQRLPEVYINPKAKAIDPQTKRANIGSVQALPGPNSGEGSGAVQGVFDSDVRNSNEGSVAVQGTVEVQPSSDVWTKVSDDILSETIIDLTQEAPDILSYELLSQRTYFWLLKDDQYIAFWYKLLKDAASYLSSFGSSLASSLASSPYSQYPLQELKSLAELSRASLTNLKYSRYLTGEQQKKMAEAEEETFKNMLEQTCALNSAQKTTCPPFFEDLEQKNIQEELYDMFRMALMANVCIGTHFVIPFYGPILCGSFGGIVEGHLQRKRAIPEAQQKELSEAEKALEQEALLRKMAEKNAVQENPLNATKREGFLKSLPKNLLLLWANLSNGLGKNASDVQGGGQISDGATAHALNGGETDETTNGRIPERDALAVRYLEREAFPNDSAYKFGDLESEHFTNTSEYKWFFSRDADEEVVGYLVVHVPPDGESPLYFDDLAVKMEFQRKGIGTDLMMRGLMETKEQIRMRGATIKVKKNTMAMRLYEKMGFRETEEVGEDDVVRMRIDPS
jgi:ribosomal protein S18 acetylase RimI-like enzyme